MALLSIEKRKSYFKKLNLGEYNEENIYKLQKKYMHKKDVDGVYGRNTDILLRHIYNVKTCTKNFEPQEFKCSCGKCTGYPSYMKQVELKHLQAIRSHYKKPMKITCGLRCKAYNDSLRGSIKNSKHLTGYAADFYMEGVTDTLAHRKAAVKWIKKRPNHGYTYGNGINSNGVRVVAGGMGNCLHTDTNKPKTTAIVITNTLKKTTIKPAALATKTIKKAKKKKLKKVELVTLEEWLAAVKKQYKWSKNSTYYWVEGPNVVNSKSRSTCISLHSVALQRIGYLPNSGYFYFHPKKKRIAGNRKTYVKKHTDLFKVTYPNKTVKQLWKKGKIKVGDMVGFGNPGYHSMIFLGFNDKKEPIFATMGHRRGYRVTYKYYAKRKVNMLVHIKTKEK